jgi:hypothetical protein
VKKESKTEPPPLIHSTMAASNPNVIVFANDGDELDGFISRIPGPENKQLGPRYCFKAPGRIEVIICVNETSLQRNNRMEIKGFVIDNDAPVSFLMRDSPEIHYRGITTDCDTEVMQKIFEMFIEDNPWLAPAYEAFQRT